VSDEVYIESPKDIERAFGSIGLKVGPRTGPKKRTKEDKEWYVLRRFMPAAFSLGLFECPLRILKRNPPEPDFALRSTSDLSSLEVTEATHPADQKEMTKFELSENADLIGTHGGRFRAGASGNHPEQVWAQDVIDAIMRKKGKSIFSKSYHRHLVIYPNSNASSLMFDDEDELEAYGLLIERAREQRDALLSLVNGCQVHILGQSFSFLDILGQERRIFAASK